MHELKQIVKLSLTLPPHIVLKKILSRCKKKWKLYQRGKRDLKKKSYSFYQSKLHRFVSPLTPPPYTAKHPLDHHFDLLGSGRVHVKYGMQAKGVEGHVYPCQAALPLKKRINSANLDYAESIWRHVDQGYVPIDWQIDFKSGYRFSEKTPSHLIQYGHLLGVDVKVPWELARMQHVPQLAWSYSTCKEEKYVREFRNQLLDFIANNPPRFGVNWSCTMDVGIRVANWLLAYDLFLNYGASFDEEFEAIFISSIYDHGKHIIDHLEWNPAFRSNHYLANIAGLLFVCSYLFSTPEVDKWLTFSIKELIKEVPLQFHQEGTSFEGSTSYHCLSSQIVAYATALAISKQGVDCFPKWYYALLEKMGEFIVSITKPNGNIVQVGDHDSGYFFRVFPPYDNHLNRQSLIKELHFKSVYRCSFPHFKKTKAKEEFPSCDLDFWKQKLNELKKTQMEFPYQREDLTCYAYKEFGLYIYRSPHFFLSVRAGSIGHLGRGGHAHNDQLSVELVIEGREIVVDPGTYLYTPLPKRRNDYRSVKAHFAPQIVGKEPSGIESGVFMMDKDPKGKCLHFDRQTFLGMHTGYEFPVYRLIELFSKKISITDFSEREELVPIEEVLKKVQATPFSPGYGIIQ